MGIRRKGGRKKHTTREVGTKNNLQKKGLPSITRKPVAITGADVGIRTPDLLIWESLILIHSKLIIYEIHKL